MVLSLKFIAVENLTAHCRISIIIISSIPDFCLRWKRFAAANLYICGMVENTWHLILPATCYLIHFLIIAHRKIEHGVPDTWYLIPDTKKLNIEHRKSNIVYLILDTWFLIQKDTNRTSHSRKSRLSETHYIFYNLFIARKLVLCFKSFIFTHAEKYLLWNWF